MAFDSQLIALIVQSGFAGLFVYLLIETRRTDAKLRDQLMAGAERREAQLIEDAKTREGRLMEQLSHCAARMDGITRVLSRLERWLETPDDES